MSRCRDDLVKNLASTWALQDIIKSSEQHGGHRVGNASNVLLIALWSLLLRLRAMDMDRWADMVGHRGGGQDHGIVADMSPSKTILPGYPTGEGRSGMRRVMGRIFRGTYPWYGARLKVRCTVRRRHVTRMGMKMAHGYDFFSFLEFHHGV